MAGYFVGPVMEKIIDKCFEYCEDQDRCHSGMEEELENLREIHPEIQAVVSAYSQAQMEDVAFNKWLWQLRDAVDEADDVLDELEYMRKHEHEEQVRNSNTTEKVMNVQRAANKDPVLDRLEVAVQKLDKVSAKVSTFRHLLRDSKQNQPEEEHNLHENCEVGSMPTNDLFSRSKEMEFVRNWLRKPCQTVSTKYADLYSKISLLSVVGNEGMGKTTLLQHVYDDEEVTKEFDVKMWISVPTSFNDRTMISNILKSLNIQMSNEESLETLQSSLKSQVLSKRFLFVLDNIWEADRTKWLKVLFPLKYGSLGSKILITTSLRSVASKFAKMIEKNTEILFLMDLEEDDCLRIFNTYAFAGVENSDHEFRSIAIKMVEKFSGCPLAAKVIGDILNTYIDKHYWKKVLYTNIGNKRSGHNYLSSILKLSYIYLPKYLQNCFAFCCMFPQDHEFDKDDLVRMWIALGFIQSSNIQEETLEDTGRKYFDILVQISFFEEFYSYDDQVYYKMHDLLHELAQSVSAQECLRVVNDKELSFYPDTIRHLSINASRSSRYNSSLVATLEKIEKFKNLRSLFLCFSDSVNKPEKLISEILKASKNIRLLVIHAKNISEMPETIGCLIHLRYLKVQCSGWLDLPRSISHLYHLQFIISKKLLLYEMDNCSGWKVGNYPTNCQFLTNELAIKYPSVLMRSISSLRFLTFEENDEFVSLPSETEQWFQQNASSLQSPPSSSESLSSPEAPPQLKRLPNPLATAVTLDLCNLESLQRRSSCFSTFSSLKFLEIRDIPLLKSLPSSLSTIPSLEALRLKNIPLLKSLPDLPPSLISICLEELENLDCLPSSLPTTLYRLWITKLPRLLELPDLPSSLQSLALEELESLDYLPSCLPATLLQLRIIKVPRLWGLPDLPHSLEVLELRELESLQVLPSCLHTSLKKLRIIEVSRLVELQDLPYTLEFLELDELESLQYLPSCLPTSLRTLRIIEVPRLLELPDIPASIESLLIEDCNL